MLMAFCWAMVCLRFDTGSGLELVALVLMLSWGVKFCRAVGCDCSDPNCPKAGCTNNGAFLEIGRDRPPMRFER